MKNIFIYIATIVFVSLILAVGWVDLGRGSKRIEFAPSNIPSSCPERVAGARGVVLQRMDAMLGTAWQVKKYVQSVEVYIAEN